MKALRTALTMVGLIGIMFFLGNCSKDNDPTPADLIVGNWKISTVNVTMKVGSQSLKDYLISQGLSAADAETFTSQITDGLADISGNLEIKKGGSYSTTSNGTTDTGTWELTADGKILTLDKGTADAVAFTVTTLNSTNLNLTADQTETDSGLTISVHFDMALTK